MKNLRIIYFQQNHSVGACEEYFYILMQGIDKKIFEVSFFCPGISALQPLIERVKDLGIEVFQYSLEISNFRLIFRLRSLFRKIKPHIVHFNDPCLNGIMAAKLAGVPISVMTHHTPELNRKFNWKGALLERIDFRYCKPHVIFTSEFDMETGIKKDKIDKGRSSVIYYGLPAEKFANNYSKKEIFEEFSLNEDCRIVANIARLSSQKAQHLLIEAAPKVLEKSKSVRFFFIGEGELESGLKTLVKRKGLENYFIFTGYRSDIPRILSACEILVMPSSFEGLCFAVIEASAMGVPVIATAVGGMRRSVIDGKTGLLIPPGDHKVLAEAIIWLLEHPIEAKQMGEEGRKYFKQQFTQGRMVNQTGQLYEQLLTKVAQRY